MPEIRTVALTFNARALFSVIRRVSYLTYYLVKASDPDGFAKALVKALREEGTAADLIRPSERVLEVGGLVWLQVVGAGIDHLVAQAELRRLMQAEGEVLIGYVVYLDTALRWGRVQISARWLRPEETLANSAPEAGQ